VSRQNDESNFKQALDFYYGARLGGGVEEGGKGSWEKPRWASIGGGQTVPLRATLDHFNLSMTLESQDMGEG